MKGLVLFSCLLMPVIRGEAQNANLLWYKMFGTGAEDTPGAIVNLSDSVFLISSIRIAEGHFNNRSTRLYWIKTNGKEVRRKTVSFGGNTSTYRIRPLANNEFIMLSQAQCQAGDGVNDHINYDFNNDIVLSRFDAFGNLLWYRCIGTSGNESAGTLLIAPDGGYYLVLQYGDEYLNGDIHESYGETDILLMKIDDAGNTLWQKHFGGSGRDSFYGALLTSDNLITLLFKTQSSDGDVAGNLLRKLYVMIKTDLSGNKVSTSYFIDFPNDLLFTNPLELSNGNILLYGSTNGIPNPLNPIIKGGSDAFFAYLHPDGTMSNLQIFGGLGEDVFWGADQFENGDIMFAGASTSNDGDLAGYSFSNMAAWYVRATTSGEIKFQDVYYGPLYGEVAKEVLVFDETEVFGMSTNHSGADTTYYRDEPESWPPDVRLCRYSFATTDIVETGNVQIAVVPNPTSEIIDIIGLMEPTSLEIFDPIGRLHQTFEKCPSKLSMKDYPRGLYIFRFESPKGQSFRRVVKE